jgi:hypothetical protein
MKRIVWHWTAGGHTPNSVDLEAYHEVIDGAGRVVRGVHPIESNKAPIRGKYAAHVRAFNSDSIGLSVAAMRGATERPFNPGPSPITPAQVEALVRRTAALCKQYSIPVTKETVLSHAEVAITHSVAQPGKWDITWLPGMERPGNSIEVGEVLRQKVRHYIASQHSPSPVSPPTNKPGWWEFLLSLFKRG